ncbi:MAG: hypothetical protein GY721_07385 [Deltaproteobacteria bacterium]|nr:hypothetical protein [Deltaproteobacteria bacterium]
MKQYKILVNKKTYEKAKMYLEELQAGRRAGNYVQEKLHGKNLSPLAVEEFLEMLMRTKRPQIFAESAVAGDGSDWYQEELSLLGDIGIATPVFRNPHLHGGRLWEVFVHSSMKIPGQRSEGEPGKQYSQLPAVMCP